MTGYAPPNVATVREDFRDPDEASFDFWDFLLNTIMVSVADNDGKSFNVFVNHGDQWFV